MFVQHLKAKFDLHLKALSTEANCVIIEMLCRDATFPSCRPPNQGRAREGRRLGFGVGSIQPTKAAKYEPCGREIPFPIIQ